MLNKMEKAAWDALRGSPITSPSNSRLELTSNAGNLALSITIIVAIMLAEFWAGESNERLGLIVGGTVLTASLIDFLRAIAVVVIVGQERDEERFHHTALVGLYGVLFCLTTATLVLTGATMAIGLETTNAFVLYGFAMLAVQLIVLVLINVLLRSFIGNWIIAILAKASIIRYSRD